MTVDERIHYQILHRSKEGIEALIDTAVTDRAPDRARVRRGETTPELSQAAVDVLNGVLLPAMKDVGDRFGAGELILPFVLQSAEVMKKAVAHLERYLERAEGYTKGKVVLATVFGDVHDIGKNLVNTILSQQRLHRLRPGQAGAAQHHPRQGGRGQRRRHRPLGAAGQHVEADAALRAGAAPARPALPGHRRRRGDQSRLSASASSSSATRGSRRPTSRASSTRATPSRGWRSWTS